MIPVQRSNEPAFFGALRNAQLTALRRLGRPPTSDDITGYRVVADELWRCHRYKCCYCERKVSCSYNDVEHYRPKARADRSPGCQDTHGYWWLAFTWTNLLFACPICNRSEKNDQFPLQSGCSPLRAEEDPPGGELPLLLDPAGPTSPAMHITFAPGRLHPRGPLRWWARPYRGSLHGAWTIRVCGLNDDDQAELRDDHVDSVVVPRVDELHKAIASARRQTVQREYSLATGLLRPTLPYVLLSYDTLRRRVPASMLRPYGLSWPPRRSVGR